MKTAIRCRTRQDFDAVDKALGHQLGSARWSTYRENTCITLESRTYGSLDWYKRNGYTVIEPTAYISCKIIGYKSPVTLFGNLEAGTTYTKKRDEDHFYSPIGKQRNDQNVPAEIVETWEPVYEVQEEILTLGSRSVVVSIKNGAITARTNQFDLVTIEKVITANQNKVEMGTFYGFINPSVRCFQIGCDDEMNLFSLNELIQVRDIANKQLGKS